MSSGVEIVGGAGEYEAAVIVAVIQAVLAEEEARARRITTTSRWRAELPEFEPGTWRGVSSGGPSEPNPSG